MYEVGLRVPVVPVVTKADTMTIREAGIYRSEVANKIANPMLKGQSLRKDWIQIVEELASFWGEIRLESGNLIAFPGTLTSSRPQCFVLVGKSRRISIRLSPNHRV